MTMSCDCHVIICLDDPTAGQGTDVHFQDFTFVPEEGQNLK